MEEPTAPIKIKIIVGLAIVAFLAAGLALLAIRGSSDSQETFWAVSE